MLPRPLVLLEAAERELRRPEVAERVDAFSSRAAMTEGLGRTLLRLIDAKVGRLPNDGWY